MFAHWIKLPETDENLVLEVNGVISEEDREQLASIARKLLPIMKGSPIAARGLSVRIEPAATIRAA